MNAFCSSAPFYRLHTLGPQPQSIDFKLTMVQRNHTFPKRGEYGHKTTPKTNPKASRANAKS